MVEAVFQILRAGKSLELIMSSYELLIEIEKVTEFGLVLTYHFFS